MSTSDENDVDSAVAKLGGKTVLERERGATQLAKLLEGASRRCIACDIVIIFLYH